VGKSLGAPVVGELVVGVIVGVDVGTLLGLEVGATISIDLLSNKLFTTAVVPTLSTVANAIVLAVFVLPAFAVAVVVVVTLVAVVVFTAGGSADLLALLVVPAWDVVADLPALLVSNWDDVAVVLFTTGGAADLAALLVLTWNVVVVVADLLALAAGEGTGTGGGPADLPDLAA
jgi:hypothetical protein